jgi:ubiquinone/menaquinone biosynthesis C-methylase UbiE
MQRILDLGCGTGDSWQTSDSDVKDWLLIGMDVQLERIREADAKYGSWGWHYIGGRGEQIPLHDGSVDGVISRGALPYMSIPQVLGELHRVLVPGGWLRFSLHPFGFTWSELKKSISRPRASLFRSLVILNGLYFHLTGKVMELGRFRESCQSERGMRLALLKAGFTNVTFRHSGPWFLVEARREGVPQAQMIAA